MTAERIAAIRGMPGRSDRTRRRLLALALRRYDCLVVNSDELRRAVINFLGSRASPLIYVIPNGVDVVPAGTDVPRRAGPLRLAFIGRDDPAKGLDVLLAALSLLEPGSVEATLVGAGLPEAVDDRTFPVQVHAFPRSDDPWSIVGECDALVLASRTEGSPNVVLEAFARRIPVLSTCAGGATALVQDGRGLLVPVGDPDALARGIRELARNADAAEQRANAAYEYVQAAHAWPQVVEAWEECLNQVARRKQ